MNTFGFSNDIWSSSLKRMAIEGGGIFGFIPDQTMIGTIFTNFLASAFLTYAQNVSIKVDDKFEMISPNLQQDNKITLHYGQRNNFLLKRKQNVSKSHLPTVHLEIKFQGDTKVLQLNPTRREGDKINLKLQLSRQKLLHFLLQPKLQDADLHEYLEFFKLNSNEFLSEFTQVDEYNPNNEQLALAVTFYDTWGQHYIRSMYFSHQYEQCLNFKSPSMQLYSNNQFNEQVDKLTDIFITLPLPEPSGYCFDDSNVPLINSSSLMDRDSGCILGSCQVKMASGEYKELSKLRKEESVFGGAKVKCVIKSRYCGSLIKIGKLFITPFHPVLIENQWQFPFDIYNNNNSGSGSSKRGEIVIESPDNTYVYNLVLDREHVIDVDGIECITLGHGMDSGILRHDYFGTNRVIDDLSKLRGWQEGFISLQSYKIKRDDRGNVCGTYNHVTC